METCPDSARVPPGTTRTVVGTEDPAAGVVLVDLTEARQAADVADWLLEKGHRPQIVAYLTYAFTRLGFPVVGVVGVVTDRIDRLASIKERYPRALCVALAYPDEVERAQQERADFVIPRPFRLDLLRSS